MNTRAPRLVPVERRLGGAFTNDETIDPLKGQLAESEQAVLREADVLPLDVHRVSVMSFQLKLEELLNRGWVDRAINVVGVKRILVHQDEKALVFDPLTGVLQARAVFPISTCTTGLESHPEAVPSRCLVFDASQNDVFVEAVHVLDPVRETVCLVLRPC